MITTTLKLVPNGGTPPTEFCIFTANTVTTSKGDFVFDKAAAASVMAAYEDHGTDLMIDYDHAALTSDMAPDPAHAGKAAGWFNLELRAGALWAVNVRWTAPAAQALRAREWRFISPAFSVDGDRISSVVNCAITNIPATKNLKPLMAATKKAKTMNTAPAVPKDNRTDSTTDVAPRIARALGLPPTASGGAIQAAYSRCDDDQRATVAGLLLGNPRAKTNVVDAAIAKLVGGLAMPKAATMPVKTKAAPPPPAKAAPAAPADDADDPDAPPPSTPAPGDPDAAPDPTTMTLGEFADEIDELGLDTDTVTVAAALAQIFPDSAAAPAAAPTKDTVAAHRRLLRLTSTKSVRDAVNEVALLARERQTLAAENAEYSAAERVRLCTKLVVEAKRPPSSVWADPFTKGVPKAFLNAMTLVELRAHVADEVAASGGRIWNAEPPKNFRSQGRDELGLTEADLRMCAESGCEPALFAKLKAARDGAVQR